jgi:uncharacterized protein (DUF2141 family)
LVGCAQVGSISGGSKDVIPPRIIKSSLKNGTTNFRDKNIEISFDEFVLLNKPIENIFIVPQDAEVEAQLTKKTLRLSFNNELQANTTYTLYLNAAVKDVSEGNDSLMQITFSTGAKLDSLKFNAIVSDAFSNQVKSKIVVGLFDSLNAEKPKYFSKSDNIGIAKLNSLKSGIYYCKAFEDKNNDLIIQKDEVQDHVFQTIKIDTSFNDTLKLRISAPKRLDKIKNTQIIAPGIITAHVPNIKRIESVKINGIATKNFFYPKKDSLIIAIGKTNENTIQLELDKDTFLLNLSQKEKLKPLKAKYIELENGTSSLIKLRYPDFVKSINSKSISILNLIDSNQVAFEVTAPFFDEVHIQLLDEQAKQLRISFKDSCIQFESGNYNFPEEILVNRREARELGSLNVKLSKRLNSGILQLLQKGKIIEEKTINGDATASQFTNLLPGEYDFRLIIDSNLDGEWSPIDVYNQIEAEEVYYFSTPIKVRANWEVETTLELNK